VCDTVVATAEATADGVTVFGKNSDREPNEAHHLLFVPAADHPPGNRVQCTYIEIPQVEHTYAVLLAKPFWLWGGEMGANEWGVVIGNEAVFSKVPVERKEALLGMDLIRLALERAATAREAVDVITNLLVEYGQGGNGGFRRKSFYYNSFLIADPRDAWVLETVSRHWVAKRVRGVCAISNGLTIGSEWDLASPDLVAYAVRKKWCKGRDDFHFARCYSDVIYTRFSCSSKRRERTTRWLTNRQGAITVADVADALRDHGETRRAPWRPDTRQADMTVCAHASFGPIRFSQTTGSMVSHLRPDCPTHFVTGTAAPCTSVFKPVWLDASLPDTGPTPTDTYDAATLFWRHEALHRATLRDYRTLIQLYQDELDVLEDEFIAGALERACDAVSERAAFAARCFADADAAETRWLERVLAAGVRRRPNRLYTAAWSRRSRQAEMPSHRK
jgi:secernin